MALNEAGHASTTDEGRRGTFMDRYIAWFHRWMPESFVICLALTLLVAALALIFTDVPVFTMDPKAKSLVTAWTGSFWSLLAFTMQMTVLLATGNAVAASPPATRVLKAVARIPRTRNQMIILGAVLTGLLGFIHWGLGLMAGIVLGRELMTQAHERGIALHMPVLVGNLFMAFLPSSAGISGAAVLYAATPGYLKKLVPDNYKAQTPDTVPMTDTVLRPDFLILLATCMVVTIAFGLLMHPKDPSKVMGLSPELLAEVEEAQKPIVVDRSTPGAKANGSRWIMYLVGGIGLL